MTGLPSSSLKPVGGLDSYLDSGAVSSDSSDEKYRSALEKITSALEAREGNNTQQLLLAISQGMLTPGPTGHFGESLGNAAGAASKVMQTQEAAGLENAKMRLQLAQAEREQGNKTKALNFAASSLGMSPQQLSSGLQSGNLPPGSFSRIKPEALFITSQLDKSVGDALSKTLEADFKNAQLAIELYRAGVDRAKIEAEFGPAVLKLLPESPFSSGASSAAPSAAPPVTPTSETKPVAEAQTDQKPPAQPAPFQPSQPPQQAAQPAPADDLEGLPLATQKAIREQRQKDMEAPFSEKRKQIYTFDPQTVGSSDSRLREIYDIVNRHPQIVGLLQGQGLFKALGSAMQQGSQTPWGTWSLPITEFQRKLKLNDTQQTIATRLSQLLGEQFFENARTNKSILGPSISNSDVMLLKAPVATAEDSAEAIKYWTKQNILGNKQKLDLYNALIEFDQSKGSKYSPAEFFNPKRNPQYDTIVKKYQSLTDELVRMHSPAYAR